MTVKHGASSTTILVDMRQSGGQMVSVGTYSLAAGSANYLEVSDSNGMAVIDAARFELVP